jgi:hypothetical protein
MIVNEIKERRNFRATESLDTGSTPATERPRVVDRLQSPEEKLLESLASQQMYATEVMMPNTQEHASFEARRALALQAIQAVGPERNSRQFEVAGLQSQFDESKAKIDETKQKRDIRGEKWWGKVQNFMTKPRFGSESRDEKTLINLGEKLGAAKDKLQEVENIHAPNEAAVRAIPTEQVLTPLGKAYNEVNVEAQRIGGISGLSEAQTGDLFKKLWAEHPLGKLEASRSRLMEGGDAILSKNRAKLVEKHAEEMFNGEHNGADLVAMAESHKAELAAFDKETIAKVTASKKLAEAKAKAFLDANPHYNPKP